MTTNRTNEEWKNPGLPKSYQNPEIWKKLKIYNFKNYKIPTQCGDDRRLLLQNMVKKIHNGVFLEIGLYAGSTVLSLYDICKCNNNKIIGIDPFDKCKSFNGIPFDKFNKSFIDESVAHFRNNRLKLEDIIEKENLSNIIKIYHNFSEEVKDLIEPNSVDIMHIDGDHSYDEVTKDLTFYYDKLKSKGMIICDDYNWKSVKCAIDDFCTKKNICKKPLNNGIILTK